MASFTGTGFQRICTEPPKSLFVYFAFVGIKSSHGSCIFSKNVIAQHFLQLEQVCLAISQVLLDATNTRQVRVQHHLRVPIHERACSLNRVSLDGFPTNGEETNLFAKGSLHVDTAW